MASRADPAAGNAAAHACPQCSKTFARLCDLNKHAKSHTRPYKCKDPGCKYATLGWPTAKELERHYNDKHSATPRTFPCYFQPCPYWSKRESNCKQHMEKAHGWKYVRSKSKGKGLADPEKVADGGYSPKDCGLAVGVDHSSSVPSSSPRSLTVPPPGMDFVLFDDDQADALGDDDDHLYPAYDAETYLPWSSPMTRLRKNEQFIETFSQTYDGLQTKPSVGGLPGNAEGESFLTDLAFYGIQHHQQAVGHDQSVGGVAIKVESPVMTVDSVLPKKRKYEPAEAPPADPEPTFSSSGAGSQPGRRAREGQGASNPSGPLAGSKYRDSGDEDGCRPTKKPKLNPVETFTDTSMPDIFRYAHPGIYDRKRAEKYSPCHTVHREISTLVRHLSRPAHRLKVTERAISSFDIADPDFRHPRVGVCRSCWETFGSREAFDDHVSRPCQKVSKGKREKWRVLFDSFTPLHDLTATDPLGSDSAQQVEEQQWESLCGHLDGPPGSDRDGAPNEARTPPTSVPSPTMPPVSGFAPLGSKSEQFISAYEHEKLQREHQALRERHQQLERMAQTLLIQRLIQENTKQTALPRPDVKPPASKNSRPGSSSATSDRDSLVQHMDSQSTDVDVYGFMQEMEDTRQTLSRMNSGLSTTSRSTIHHVPPSPPSRPVELSGLGGSGVDHPQPKRSYAHRAPLPSIPDSGYGTEQRRGSLGELPAGAGQLPFDAKPLTPPSTAEAAEETKKDGGSAHDWEDSQLQRVAGANASSPPHSQPGFLTEQEIADYGDDSYNLFYQDNMLQSRSSPLGFTFDYPSQVE